MAVVSAIQATTQLVEQVFRIFKRLRDANARQKGLPEVLARHYSELKSVKAIMGMIYDEQDLKTPTVAAELVRLQDVSERLAALIKTLVPSTTSKMIQFARQLVDGSADEKKLSAIMGELVQVKAVLVLSIQVAHVGVVRTMVRTSSLESCETLTDYGTHVGETSCCKCGSYTADRRVLPGACPGLQGPENCTTAQGPTSIKWVFG